MRRAALFGLVIATVTACSGDSGAQNPAGGPCPERLVIQTDWMPQIEHGGTYHLIEPDAAIVDAARFRYSGPVRPAYAVGGLKEVEIRAGASAISFAPVASELYTSDDVHLGYLGATDAVRQGVDTPVIGVAKTLESDPRVLIWDPRRFTIERPEDLATSGARVHHFPRLSFITWLIDKGWMTRGQSDDSFDGSFREWILTEGGIVQQGYVTNEVYQLENTVGWSDGSPAPVDYALLSDWGFREYPSMHVVRADRLEELSSCLKLLVPILSQAWVDFLDRPDEVVEAIEAINLDYEFWETPAAMSRFALDKMEQLGLATNSADGTYCSFDESRVRELTTVMVEVLRSQGGDVPSEASLAQLTTNRFCDGAPGRG